MPARRLPRLPRFLPLLAGLGSTFLLGAGGGDDRPVVTIGADSSAVEPHNTVPETYPANTPAPPQDDGIRFITVTLSTPAPSNITVPVTFTGTAARGETFDYTASAASVTFRTGQSVASLALVVHNDAPGPGTDPNEDEGNETVVVTLSPPGSGGAYQLGARTACTHTIVNWRGHSSNGVYQQKRNNLMGISPGVNHTFLLYDRADYKRPNLPTDWGHVWVNGDDEVTQNPAANVGISYDEQDASGQYTGNPNRFYEVSDWKNEGYQAHFFSTNAPARAATSNGPEDFLWHTADRSGNVTAYLNPPFNNRAPANDDRMFNGPLYWVHHTAAFDEFLRIPEGFEVGPQGFVSPPFSIVPSPREAMSVSDPAVRYTFVFDTNPGTYGAWIKAELQVFDGEGRLHQTINDLEELALNAGTQTCQFTFAAPHRPGLDSRVQLTHARLKLIPSQPVQVSRLENYRHHMAPNPYFGIQQDGLRDISYFCFGLPQALNPAQVTPGSLTVSGIAPLGGAPFQFGRQAQVIKFEPNRYSGLGLGTPVYPGATSFLHHYRFELTDTYGRNIVLNGGLVNESYPDADLSQKNFWSKMPLGMWGPNHAWFFVDKPASRPNPVINSIIQGLEVDWFQGSPSYTFQDQVPFNFHTRAITPTNPNPTQGSFFDWVVNGTGTVESDGLPKYDSLKATGLDTIFPFFGGTPGHHDYYMNVSRHYRRQEAINAAVVAGQNVMVDAPELTDALRDHASAYETLSYESAYEMIQRIIANTSPGEYHSDKITAYHIHDEPAYKSTEDQALFNRIFQTLGRETLQAMVFQFPWNAMSVEKIQQYCRKMNTKAFLTYSYAIPPLAGFHLGDLGFSNNSNYVQMTENVKKVLLRERTGAGVPYWSYIQAFGDSPLRQPFHTEVRCMSWLAAGVGMNGIFYFTNLTNSGFGIGHDYPWKEKQGNAAFRKYRSAIAFEKGASPTPRYGEPAWLTYSAGTPLTNYDVAIDTSTMYDAVKEFAGELNARCDYRFAGVQYSRKLSDVLNATEPFYDGLHPYTRAYDARFHQENPGAAYLVQEVTGGGSNVKDSQNPSQVRAGFPDRAYTRWFVDQANPGHYYLHVVNYNCNPSVQETVRVTFRDNVVPEAVNIKNGVSVRESPRVLTVTLKPGEGTVLLLRLANPDACATAFPLLYNEPPVSGTGLGGSDIWASDCSLETGAVDQWWRVTAPAGHRVQMKLSSDDWNALSAWRGSCGSLFPVLPAQCGFGGTTVVEFVSDGQEYLFLAELLTDTDAYTVQFVSAPGAAAATPLDVACGDYYYDSAGEPPELVNPLPDYTLDVVRCDGTPGTTFTDGEEAAGTWLQIAVAPYHAASISMYDYDLGRSTVALYRDSGTQFQPNLQRVGCAEQLGGGVATGTYLNETASPVTVKALVNWHAASYGYQCWVECRPLGHSCQEPMPVVDGGLYGPPDYWGEGYQDIPGISLDRVPGTVRPNLSGPWIKVTVPAYESVRLRVRDVELGKETGVALYDQCGGTLLERQAGSDLSEVIWTNDYGLPRTVYALGNFVTGNPGWAIEVECGPAGVTPDFPRPTGCGAMQYGFWPGYTYDQVPGFEPGYTAVGTWLKVDLQPRQAVSIHLVDEELGEPVGILIRRPSSSAPLLTVIQPADARATYTNYSEQAESILVLLNCHAVTGASYYEVTCADVPDLDCSWQHTLARKRNGQLYGWGSNWTGQMGMGNTAPFLSPTLITTLGQPVKSAATYTYSSLASLADGTVRSWGTNGLGQLGNGTTNYSLVPVTVQKQSDQQPLTGVTSVAMGAEQSCAVGPNGTAWCWGNNSWGQLGDGTSVAKTRAVQAVWPDGTAFTGASQMASGYYHVMALRPSDSGKVYCWGYNNWGSVGDGDWGGQKYRPNRCVIKDDGTALTGIIQIAAGSAGSFALDNQGFVWSWGANDYGMLGQGHNDPRAFRARKVMVNAAAPLTGMVPLAGVVQISAHSQSALAVTKDGKLYAWGLNGNGQLGLGAAAIGQNFNLAQPVPIPADRWVTSAQIGGHSYSQALTADGKRWVWGKSSTNGWFGNGTTTDSALPLEVVGPALP